MAHDAAMALVHIVDGWNYDVRKVGWKWRCSATRDDGELKITWEADASSQVEAVAAVTARIKEHTP